MIVETEKLHTKKPDILRAALKLFVENGINGTTIRDIAQEAGVGEGTLYCHFKSKEEMAWQLFYQNLKQFTQELHRQVEGTPGDWRQKVRAAVKAFFELAEEKPVLFSYLLGGEHTELKKFPQEALRPKDVLIQLVDEVKEAGMCREMDSPLGGGLLLGMILRVAMSKREGLITARLTDLIDKVAAACCRVVGQDP